MKSYRHAGSIKLNGKKFKLLSCKCCSCQDFRDEVKSKEMIKEIKQWKYSIAA